MTLEIVVFSFGLSIVTAALLRVMSRSYTKKIVEVVEGTPEFKQENEGLKNDKTATSI